MLLASDFRLAFKGRVSVVVHLLISVVMLMANVDVDVDVDGPSSTSPFHVVATFVKTVRDVM